MSKPFQDKNIGKEMSIFQPNTEEAGVSGWNSNDFDETSFDKTNRSFQVLTMLIVLEMACIFKCFEIECAIKRNFMNMI